MVKLSELILKLEIPRHKQVYYPSDDSYLFIDYLDSLDFNKFLQNIGESKKTISILDLGCGTGILGFFALIQSIKSNFFSSASLTYADVNAKAIEVTKLLVHENEHILKDINGFTPNLFSIDYYITDLFQNIPNQFFDMVLFNPPYLPQDEEIIHGQLIDKALYSGPEGITTIRDFFSQVGMFTNSISSIFFILSTLGSLQEFIPNIQSQFHITLLQNIHMFFEDFALFHARKKSIMTNNL